MLNKLKGQRYKAFDIFNKKLTFELCDLSK